MNGQAANLLLAALPSADRDSLLKRLKPVALPLRTVLYEPDETPKYAHFMTSGIASIVSSMANGASAEVGVWGSEGLVESFHLLGRAKIPTRCFIQMDATALRMPYKELQKEFLENEGLRETVLQCVQSQGFILATGSLQSPARGGGTSGALAAHGARPGGKRNLLPHPGVLGQHAGRTPHHGDRGRRNIAAQRVHQIQPWPHPHY